MSTMREELRRAMAAVEKGQALSEPMHVRWAAISGLGSKYLAVGSPESIGLVDCGAAATWLIECHELLFGKLRFKLAGDNVVDSSWSGGSSTLRCQSEEAFACDIVCAPCTLDFDSNWIAEATHLNLRYQAPGPSASSCVAMASCGVTLESTHAEGVVRSHGSLAEVITGRVSGRMADELTILLHD